MYFIIVVFFFKQKTAYEMRISDWSSDVCSSDLLIAAPRRQQDESGSRVDSSARHRADQLVERVMPPNILAHQLDRARRRAEGGGVGRAGRAAERLVRVQRDRKSTRLNSSH